MALSEGAVARPLAFVVAIAVAEPPKAALAVEPVAVKVTVAPLTGFPLASFTVAWSAVGNAVFTTALCGVPDVAVTLAAVPGRFVRLKVAAANPGTVAVTVNGPA